MKNDLILRVETRSASELVKHSDGPGRRYVFSDNKNSRGGRIYCVVRIVKNLDMPKQHVKPHRHDYESLFVFKGNNKGLSGLEAEVLLERKWHRIKSPKAVRIPAGVMHAYRFVKGSGEFWNILITHSAHYNKVTE